jgi:uncharacterized protein (TIGR03663 family)
MSRERPSRPPVDRVVVAVAVVVLAALAARLVGLGARSFHWDEARVGYWTLRYAATGAFDYRPVAGGPFFYQVDRLVFALVGASDASARLVVAGLGGLVPAVAILYRDRLGAVGTVALATLLAADPLLVYYSRFLRGEVPLAAFSLVAVAAAVRAIDADASGDDRLVGRRPAVYLAVGAGALALTTSGFVAVTLACWLVAAALVVDHRRLLDAGPAREAAGTAREAAGTATDGAGTDAEEGRPTAHAPRLPSAGELRRRLRPGPLAGRATLLAAAVLVWFYAPRAGGGPGPGLWKLGTLPATIDAALFGSVAKFYGVFVADRSGVGATHELLPYVLDYLGTLGTVSTVLVALALAGFLLDRYRSAGPSPVVAFHAYWGFATVLFVPLAAEVRAPWLAVHAVAPLAVPAAVGAAALVRAGRRAWGRADAGTVAAVGLLLVAAGGHVGAVAAGDVYAPPAADSRVAHYAQPPAGQVDALVANATAAAAGNDGVDVLYHGGALSTSFDAGGPPVPPAFAARLPLAWYFEREGLRTASVATPEAVASTAPPVVVTVPGSSDAVREALGRTGTAYRAHRYDLALWDRTVVVFVADG